MSRRILLPLLCSFLRLGRGSLNEKMWNARLGSYLLYYEPETGKKSAEIMASQLAGDFASFVKRLNPVFPRDRALTVLDTVKRTCFVDIGVVAMATPEGKPDPTAYGTAPIEVFLLGMIYAYYGDPRTGLDLVYRNMRNLAINQRHAWDLTNMLNGDTGERTGGTDYQHNMVLWALPAALEDKDLMAPLKPDGLVDRVLRAARGR